MNTCSRRSFFFASSGAIAGSLVVNGYSEAADRPVQNPSGLNTGKPKALKFTEIPGFLSAQQIAPHHTAHYGGALKAFTSIDAQFEKSFLDGTTIDPQAFETIQRQKASRGNSVILHEFYFDGLAMKPADPGDNLRAAIQKRFGSLEKWTADFIASAKAAAGWAILIHHPVNGRLYNVVSDEHAMGALWMATPLIVVDVYEHAYYVDYQNKKADYIEKFVQHIDWVEAANRFEAVA